MARVYFDPLTTMLTMLPQGLGTADSPTFNNLKLTGDIFDSNGVTILDLAPNANAVNYFRLINATTGNGPAFSAQGSDTNISIFFTPKGSGSLRMQGDAAFTDGKNIATGTTTGMKIGTSNTQKFGFWNTTPVAQQVLATGAGHTVDDVISLLQTLGICRQS